MMSTTKQILLHQIIMLIYTSTVNSTINVERRSQGDIVRGLDTCSTNKWDQERDGRWACLCKGEETFFHLTEQPSKPDCKKPKKHDTKCSVNDGKIKAISHDSGIEDLDFKMKVHKGSVCDITNVFVWNIKGINGLWDTSWTTELQARIAYNGKEDEVQVTMKSHENWSGLLLKIDLTCKAHNKQESFCGFMKVEGRRPYPITEPQNQLLATHPPATTAAPEPETTKATQPSTTTKKPTEPPSTTSKTTKATQPSTTTKKLTEPPPTTQKTTKATQATTVHPLTTRLRQTETKGTTITTTERATQRTEEQGISKSKDPTTASTIYTGLTSTSGVTAKFVLDSGGNTVGMSAGISTAVLVLLLSVVAMFFFIRKRRYMKKEPPSTENVMAFKNLSMDDFEHIVAENKHSNSTSSVHNKAYEATKGSVPNKPKLIRPQENTYAELQTASPLNTKETSKSIYQPLESGTNSNNYSELNRHAKAKDVTNPPAYALPGADQYAALQTKNNAAKQQDPTYASLEKTREEPENFYTAVPANEKNIYQSLNSATSRCSQKHISILPYNNNEGPEYKEVSHAIGGKEPLYRELYESNYYQSSGADESAEPDYKEIYEYGEAGH